MWAGGQMEVNPRGGCDHRDPVLVYEALELRYLCLSEVLSEDLLR